MQMYERKPRKHWFPSWYMLVMMLFSEPLQSWRSVYVVNTGLKTAKKIEKHWKLTLGPLVSSADNFAKKVWTQTRPDKTSGSIRIQSVRQPDGIPERIFRKRLILNKKHENFSGGLENSLKKCFIAIIFYIGHNFWSNLLWEWRFQ